MRDIETIVVGGGPAGAATACGLAAAGREVMLVERSSGPHHKVCGEFLSIETQAQLQKLGVDPIALGAVAIDEVAIYSSTRSVSAKLPFRALSLSRYRLDDALMRRAFDSGAHVRRSVSARAVMRKNDGWTVRCDDGEILRCRHLVLATGKWGLRGIDDARDAARVGLKMHLRLSPAQQRALVDRVELALMDDGYAGLELIEDGIANLCFLLPRAVVAALAPGWQPLQDYLAAAVPHLAERLADATPLWDKALAVVCPTGGYLHREEYPQAYRVGDRLAHIPPFTGDGLAIALGSAALAAEHIVRGDSPAAALAATRRLTGNGIRLASALSGLARNRVGRAVLLGAAALVPAFVGSIVQGTRLPLAAQRL